MGHHNGTHSQISRDSIGVNVEMKAISRAGQIIIYVTLTALLGEGGIPAQVAAPLVDHQSLLGRLVAASEPGNAPQAILRAKETVSAFTGRELDSQLTFKGSMWTQPFGLSWVLGCEATGEVFEVRERDGLITEWEFGRYLPPLEPSASAPREFERAFMERYYRQLPTDQMEVWREALGDGRTSVYIQKLAPGLLSMSSSCRFDWANDLQTLRRVVVAVDPVEEAVEVAIRPEQAVERAQQFVAAWDGVTSATGALRPVAGPSWAEHAVQMLDDDLGLQRAAYQVEVQIAFAPRMARQIARDSFRGTAPESVLCYVDVQTGACFTFWAPTAWPVAVAHGYIDLLLPVPGGRGAMYCYSPRRADGHDYLCAKFMQSWLWEGKYTRDGERFKVEYQAGTWDGTVGDRALGSGDYTQQFPVAPRIFEEEVYLPVEMIAHMTGWVFSRPYEGVVAVDPPRK